MPDPKALESDGGQVLFSLLYVLLKNHANPACSIIDGVTDTVHNLRSKVLLQLPAVRFDVNTLFEGIQNSIYNNPFQCFQLLDDAERILKYDREFIRVILEVAARSRAFMKAAQPFFDVHPFVLAAVFERAVMCSRPDPVCRLRFEFAILQQDEEPILLVEDWASFITYLAAGV